MKKRIYVATIKTLEGDVTASYPHYIAVGAKGELYVNTKQFVEDNLIIITARSLTE